MVNDRVNDMVNVIVNHTTQSDGLFSHVLADGIIPGMVRSVQPLGFTPVISCSF